MQFSQDIISAFLIGLSLSMDAFAVSISAGVSTQTLKKRDMFRASFCFGLFQFFMPLAGWFLGGAFVKYIKAFDHWAAFALLVFVGLRMIIPSKNEKDPNPAGIRSFKTLLILALATSLDALAVGLSYSMVNGNILLLSVLSGCVTILVCITGFLIGKKVGAAFEKKAQIAGGIVLILIGVKILAEHLLA